MKFSKEYAVIFIILVTEVLGFSLILPFLPFFAEELGASPLVVGLILTAFSLCQFISAPIMGKLSDHYGRKPMLIISQISTFISFIILGFANSLWLIFLSRIIDGIIGSNFTIAQAYLSDISSKKDRSKVFGLSGAAFGVGFLIGPAIGGILAGSNYSYPAFAAAGISLLSIILTTLFLKETITRKKDIQLSLKMFHLNDYKKYFLNKKISPRLWQFFMYILAHMIWVSSAALYAKRQLGFTARDMGFALAYVGLVSIILRGFLLGKLIDKFSEKKLLYFAIITMILGLIFSAFVNQVWMFYLVLTLFAGGGGLTRPLLMGSISRLSSPKEQGAIIGVSNSLGSVAQIIGPIVGGTLITYFIPGSLGIAAAFAMFLGLLIMIKQEKIIFT